MILVGFSRRPSPLSCLLHRPPPPSPAGTYYDSEKEAKALEKERLSLQEHRDMLHSDNITQSLARSEGHAFDIVNGKVCAVFPTCFAVVADIWCRVRASVSVMLPTPPTSPALEFPYLLVL